MSTATLSRRLEALEAVSHVSEGPQVVFLVPMRRDDEPAPTAEDATVAFVVNGRQLARHDGETGAAFLARVEVERLRVHVT